MGDERIDHCSDGCRGFGIELSRERDHALRVGAESQRAGLSLALDLGFESVWVDECFGMLDRLLQLTKRDLCGEVNEDRFSDLNIIDGHYSADSIIELNDLGCRCESNATFADCLRDVRSVCWCALTGEPCFAGAVSADLDESTRFAAGHSDFVLNEFAGGTVAPLTRNRVRLLHRDAGSNFASECSDHAVDLTAKHPGCVQDVDELCVGE